ncbi:Acetoacetyl-CoA reductase of ethylmalonyl-CoA pathway [hydrothermal vent metagenome]|uniref:Acetoacetyl-CoA reductase of ethylmalonyl-CoA pathway n=1 Tax=hydrothermal vent metagenome TaxID=652676 RepID=A0A3B0SBH2_9ZZZZ
MTRKLCLITGASAGIGAALAREFASRGWDLALTARRKDRLEDLAEELKAKFGVDSLIIPADLSKKTAPKAIVKAIQDAGRQVDGLVNNAGYGLPGTFTQPKWKDHEQFLQVMLTAPLELCYLTLPGMRERKFGRIINVASLAGHLPGSMGHTLYGADKSFLVKFSESLNLENTPHGVHVSALCPGFTYSEFHDVNATRSMVAKMPGYMWQTAEEVARSGVQAVEKNAAVLVTGGVNKTIAILAKLLPGWLARNMMRSQSKNFRKQEGE